MSIEAVACSLCGLAMNEEAKTWCDTCHQTICPACFSWHPCLAKNSDFSDSAPTTPRGSVGTLLEEDSPTFLEEDSPSEGTIVENTDEFASYQAVPRFVQIKENVYMHLEPFEVMSYVTLTDHCGSHAFGHTLQDFQILCESTAWDLPEGLVVFNASIGKSLVFQSGVVASTIALWSAIHYLRARQSIGLIMHREGEWLIFSLVEVHRYLGHRKFHSPIYCEWRMARSHGGDGDGEISLRTDSPIAPRETYIDRVPSRIRCFLRHVFFPRVDDRSCDIWPSSPRREKHINRELPYRLTCLIS